jgi:hypothetical protein
LRVFPFDRYRIGAITIEHSNLEEHRIQLRDLLEACGNRLEWAIRDQDWYVSRETLQGFESISPPALNEGP